MEDRESYQPRRQLYRDPDRGKICGVCAGVAEYFGFETWVVRVVAVSLLLFTSGGMIPGYFIACWVLDVKPGSKSKSCIGSRKSRRSSTRNTESTEHAREQRYKPNVQDVWKKGTSPANTVQRINKKMANMEQRLRPMESFVTSDKFALDKEFESIQDSPVERD
jgi:phage shock protein C